MGTNLIAFQLKQACQKELIGLLGSIRDHFDDHVIVEKALAKRKELIEAFIISYVLFPASSADDILMILSENASPSDDPSKPGYIAIYGKVENELSHPDAHISYLDPEDIKVINSLFVEKKITNREGFANYFEQLPQSLKSSLLDDWEEGEEVEYYWKMIKELMDFYQECELNTSWVYLDNG